MSDYSYVLATAVGPVRVVWFDAGNLSDEPLPVRLQRDDGAVLVAVMVPPRHRIVLRLEPHGPEPCWVAPVGEGISVPAGNRVTLNAPDPVHNAVIGVSPVDA